MQHELKAPPESPLDRAIRHRSEWEAARDADYQKMARDVAEIRKQLQQINQQLLTLTARKP